MAAETVPGEAADTTPLPPLRDELDLFPGPRAADGSPTWTLHDPARNRYFRLGWPAFEILTRWPAGDAESVADQVSRETPLEVGTDDVNAVARFLADEDLIRGTGPRTTERLARQIHARRPHWAHFLVTNYLFFRVPLVKPDRFLAVTYPVVRWLYHPAAGVTLAVLGVLGLFLALRQWDSFAGTLTYFFSPAGVAWFAVALVGAKIIHELGHAYTAHRFGCRVPTMGVAFLVMWPVLYTDTSDGWTLTDRRARLAIGAAGMAAELAVAVLATLLWSFLPDGPVRGAVFLLATTTWVGTLFINLTPFMRFDGYYLLADWLGMPNLFSRAFAFGKWWLRETLFGAGEPPPEAQPAPVRRFLILFAVLVWVYRFFLFLGIAVMVYHFFFKLLGIILMAVELGHFIVRPIWQEVREWRRRGHHTRINANTVVTGLILAGLVVLVVVPWKTTVEAPALLHSADSNDLYAPRAGRATAVRVAEGNTVAKGAVLVRMVSPGLDDRIERAKRRTELLRWKLAGGGTRDKLRRKRLVIRKEFQAARQALAGYRAERRKLTVRAPAAGTVTHVARHLKPGQWVAADRLLVTVVDRQARTVRAYVPESDLGRLTLHNEATFYPDNPDRPPVPCRLEDMDTVGINHIQRPVMASVNGGPVPTRKGPKQARGGRGKPVPEQGTYRVRLVPWPDGGGPEAPMDRVQRGTVRIQAEALSLIGRAWRIVVGVLVRESGF